LIDRAKDIIKSGGEWISSAVLEDALRAKGAHKILIRRGNLCHHQAPVERRESAWLKAEAKDGRRRSWRDARRMHQHVSLP
jgi:acyl-CoA synthetase (AMP-forming)/AMP-acid ligase II